MTRSRERYVITEKLRIEQRLDIDIKRKNESSPLEDFSKLAEWKGTGHESEKASQGGVDVFQRRSVSLAFSSLVYSILCRISRVNLLDSVCSYPTFQAGLLRCP